MNTNLIKISKEYPGLWLGQEISVAPGEDKMQAWVKAHQELNQAYQLITSGQMTDFNTGQVGVIDYKAKEQMEIQIDSATTGKEMAKLLDDALKLGLQDHWQRRYKEINMPAPY